MRRSSWQIGRRTLWRWSCCRIQTEFGDTPNESATWLVCSRPRFVSNIRNEIPFPHSVHDVDENQVDDCGRNRDDQKSIRVDFWVVRLSQQIHHNSSINDHSKDSCQNEGNLKAYCLKIICSLRDSPHKLLYDVLIINAIPSYLFQFKDAGDPKCLSPTLSYMHMTRRLRHPTTTTTPSL